MIVRSIAIVAPLLATSAATAQAVEVVDEPVRIELLDAACAPGVCTCTGEVFPEGRLAAYGLSARSLEIGVRCIAADFDGDDTIDITLHAAEGLAVVIRHPAGGGTHATVIDAGGVLELYEPRATVGPHGEPVSANHGLWVHWVGQFHAFLLWDGATYQRTLLAAWPLPPAPGAANRDGSPACGNRTDAPLVIDRERIGPFPASATLDELRRMCPGAVPTVGYGFETVWAALELGIGDLEIFAGQNWRNRAFVDDPRPMPEIDGARPASHWGIRGCGALLPGGVSSCATWAELTAIHGTTGELETDFGEVRVSLNALPGFRFELDVRPEALAILGNEPELGTIPAGARIVSFDVVPQAPARRDDS